MSGQAYTFYTSILLREPVDKVDNVASISALSLDFSVSLLDSVTAIGYYDLKEKKAYAFLGLQRTYDNWLFSLSVFSSRKDELNSYSGKGAQFMVTYNH